VINIQIFLFFFKLNIKTIQRKYPYLREIFINLHLSAAKETSLVAQSDVPNRQEIIQKGAAEPTIKERFIFPLW
jgi:hypothetical protein